MKKTIFMVILMSLVTLGAVSASMQLDSIQFDPAIIASGDEVDIVMQFHSDRGPYTEGRVGDSEYSYRVHIEADDTLTEKYVIIQDSEGDDINRAIFAGDRYNKKFRVKVSYDAPAGNYEFKLVGQWYKDGEPLAGTEFMRFIMPVKKEGIILDVTTLETAPSEVRPGDNYVKLVTRIENVGEKDAKSVEINLDLPEGLKSSYTNDNRVWVGMVNAGESKEVIFFVDIDEKIKDGIYDISYDMNYMDVDNNEYEKSRVMPFLVKPRPYLVVVDSVGTGLAGDNTKLTITVKNTGTESAESIDVRLLKQNSQPFTIDVRSDYIGELEPGEEGIAVFDINVNSDAEFKTHSFKLLIRSKGDSDEGDDNIYMYNRRAQFDVIGQAPNKLKGYGIVATIVVIGFMVANSIYKRRVAKKAKRSKK